jgi:hypothetical protein
MEELIAELRIARAILASRSLITNCDSRVGN